MVSCRYCYLHVIAAIAMLDSVKEDGVPTSSTSYYTSMVLYIPPTSCIYPSTYSSTDTLARLIVLILAWLLEFLGPASLVWLGFLWLARKA